MNLINVISRTSRRPLNSTELTPVVYYSIHFATHGVQSLNQWNFLQNLKTAEGAVDQSYCMTDRLYSEKGTTP